MTHAEIDPCVVEARRRKAEAEQDLQEQIDKAERTMIIAELIRRDVDDKDRD